MRVEVVTAPETEPIQLADAKKWCRVDADITDEDDLITELITTAREVAEAATSRAFAEQTLRVTFDSFPCGNGILRIPRHPLISVTDIKYDDPSGAEQTLSSSTYRVVTHSIPGSIYSENDWPDTDPSDGAVRVTYVAGYGKMDGETPISEGLPKKARTLMLYLINHWYHHRELAVVGASISDLPMAAQSLINQLDIRYRAHR